MLATHFQENSSDSSDDDISSSQINLKENHYIWIAYICLHTTYVHHNNTLNSNSNILICKICTFFFQTTITTPSQYEEVQVHQV